MKDIFCTLESILRALSAVSEQRRDLEKQHAESLQQLHHKIQTTNTNKTTHDKRKNQEHIEQLQSTIRELEKKTELQNVKHEELVLELAALKQQSSAVRAASSLGGDRDRDRLDRDRLISDRDRGSPLLDSHTLCSTPSVCSLSSSNLNRQTNDHTQSTPSKVVLLSHSLPRTTHSKSYSHPPSAHHYNQQSKASYSARKRLRRSNSVSDLTRTPFYSARTFDHHYYLGQSGGHGTQGAGHGTHGPGGTTSTHHHRAQQQHGHSTATGIETYRKSVRRSLPRKPPSAGITHYGQIPQIRIDAACAGGGITNIPVGIYHHQPGLSLGHTAPFLAGTTLLSSTHGGQYQPSSSHHLQQQHHSSQHQQQHHGTSGQLTIPTIIVDNQGTATAATMAASSVGVGGIGGGGMELNGRDANVDVLEIPGHGRCFVYIARYSYDPFTMSPNENPESELYLNAGDYLLVWSRPDEDGYLDAQLVMADGRRGLVPSNYVQRLYGEDLIEFYQQVVLARGNSSGDQDTMMMGMTGTSMQGMGGGAGTGTGMTPMAGMDSAASMLQRQHQRQDDYSYLDVLQRRSAEEQQSQQQQLQRLDLSYLELEDVLESESEFDRVPAPTALTLERQLNKSILISWSHPIDCPLGTIDSYQVYVNGLLRCTIKANERTRALIEGVDSNRPHRISVRAMTPNRRTSRDAACTMVIGRNAPLAPSCVRATNITSTSAIISWLPANSNYQHVVSVNNVEVRTVKPGVYRHTITVLSANTIYRVTVRSKHVRGALCDEKNIKQMDRLSASTEFRTLPKGCLGLPDPPVDVQVEPGPQDNTLLVTWHPLVAGTSNGAIVTGYAVFADGRKVLEIDSPSGDHALLDLNRFQGFIPKQVTVRTKSHDSLSSDSIPIQIPAQIRPSSRYQYKSTRLQSFPTSSAATGTIITDDESYSDHDFNYHRASTSFQQQPLRRHHIPPQPPPQSRGMGGVGGYGGGFQPNTNTRRQQHQQQQPPILPMHDEYSSGGGGYGVPPSSRRGGVGGRMGGGVGRMGPMRVPPEQRYRLFVALFDYDPPSMSPNPDACEEELPFREGQMIKIYGDKDADGFYWGEAGGRRGYVPCNMVSEVHPDDERAAQELINVGDGMSMTSSGRERRGMGRDRWGDIYANMPMKKMISLYDYDPQELSPNVDSEVELSFRTGDIIYVFGDMDDDGFFMGELNGVRGLVPSNFLTEAPPEGMGGPRGGGGGGRGGRHLGPLDQQQQLMQQQQQQRRPGQLQQGQPGPGARGPPPPPPKGLSSGGSLIRRKDASFPSNDILTMTNNNQQELGLRNHYDKLQSNPQSQQQQQPTLSHQQQQHHQMPQQQQQNVGSRRMQPQQPTRGGVPAVVPQFSPQQQTTPLQQQQQPQQQHTSLFSQPLKLPTIESSNLMQKFSELTHGGMAAAVGGNAGAGGTGTAGGGDSIFKTGKELIFKKFGLGE